MLVKQQPSPFFDFVRDGCNERAAELNDNVECIYDGPSPNATDRAADQLAMFQQYVASGEVDAIAVSVIDADLMKNAIDEAMDVYNIPIFTFDSDASMSKRKAYVGTNNTQFGYEFGKVLIQLNPKPVKGKNGRRNGMVGYISTFGTNLVERHKGLQTRINGFQSNWEEVAGSPAIVDTLPEVALEKMREFAANPTVKAIVMCCGFPMSNATAWQEFVTEYPDLTLIAGDSNDNQIDLSRRGYIDALIGQEPFVMGQLSVDAMYNITKHGIDPEKEYIGTPAIQTVRVPLTLGPRDVEPNNIDNLAILAYLLYSIVAALSLGFGGWTIWKRTNRVVVASQPEFLVLICVGCLILGSALIPLTIDDNTHTPEQCNAACMSTPWLASIGFTLTFSALFSKTWRVNQVFKNARKFRRVVVTAKDVLLPLVLLLAANIVTLTLWTVLAPLTYERAAHEGTDEWNRVISSYGRCKSTTDRKGGAWPYVIILLAINVSVIVIANLQAYQARTIKTEYSESQYIAITIAFIGQAILLGAPVFALVQSSPQVMFAVGSLMLFTMCAAPLLFIFVPKINHVRAIEKSTSSSRMQSVRGLRLKIMRSEEDPSTIAEPTSAQKASRTTGVESRSAATAVPIECVKNV